MDVTYSNSTFPVTVLLMRTLTFIFLLVALIFIATNTITNDYTGDKLGFKDVYAYRYMISTIVIGFAYNLLQLVFSVFTVISGKRVIRGDSGYQFDFYGDKIISYFLISGATAGLSLNIELRNDLPSNSFLDKANISASLLLVGFLFTAIASIFTSFALPKKTIN